MEVSECEAPQWRIIELGEACDSLGLNWYVEETNYLPIGELKVGLDDWR